MAANYDKRGGGSSRNSNSKNSGSQKPFHKKRYSDDSKEEFKRDDRKYEKNKPKFGKKPFNKEKPLEDIIEEVKKDGPIRLNRFIANSGFCSRREADEVISSGKVSINGKVVTELGIKVSITDTVEIEGKTISSQKKVYILLNKPKDTITTKKDPQKRRTVYHCIAGACEESVEAVGRLDRNTTGVLLLTNDGDLHQQLTHPKYGKMKIYHAFLDKSMTMEDFEKLSEGVTIDDELIVPDDLQFVGGNKSEIGMQIHSGKYHVVKRMFEAVGYNVEKLDRVYFAGLTKKNLARGKWRMLTKAEVAVLKQGAYQ